MEKVFSVEKIGNLSIDMLMSPEMNAEIDHAVSTIQKSQEAFYSLANDDNTKLTGIKAGTVLIVSIINKVSKGKGINEFTKDDWKEISASVIDNAVLMDEMKYSKMVFLTYADYIDTSVLSISRFASEDKVEAIKTLSSEIRAKSETLDKGEINIRELFLQPGSKFTHHTGIPQIHGNGNPFGSLFTAPCKYKQRK